MAYRCGKYGKVLVGPIKTCQSRCGMSLEDKCDYRTWQEGVLKPGGRRATFKKPIEERLPDVFAFEAAVPGGQEKARLNYVLGDDDDYHYLGRDPPGGLTVFPVITKDDFRLAKECGWDYPLFLEKMISKRLQK